MTDSIISTLDLAPRTLLLGSAALSKLAFDGFDMASLRDRLAEADPLLFDPAVLLDLSTIETILGNRVTARQLQNQAFDRCRLFCRPAASSEGNGLRLLAIMASGDLMANTPLEFLIEHSDITLVMAFCRPGEPLPAQLPEHDVVFVAIGESEESRPTLRAIARQLANSPVPVINAPEAIARLGRAEVAAALRRCVGVVAPPTSRVLRADLMAASSAGSFKALFPVENLSAEDEGAAIIVRPVASHAGNGLEKLAAPAELEDYLARHRDDAFYVSVFVDYSNSDGMFRKYRVALIDGVPYASHMAISKHWMIHYLNAGMWDDAGKRAEESRWMQSFDREFAVRHAQAFKALVSAIGLDYFVIDCGETRSGDLLIFEADVAMLVHAMDHPFLFGYKQAPMKRLFQAFQSMLQNRHVPCDGFVAGALR